MSTESRRATQRPPSLRPPALLPPALLLTGAALGGWRTSTAIGPTVTLHVVLFALLAWFVLWRWPQSCALQSGALQSCALQSWTRRARRLAVPAAAAALALAVSSFASPVPRAGWTGLSLLPAYLAVVPAVAASWRRPVARRQGEALVATVMAAVATWSLVGWLVLGTPGASLPLEHHNLLAIVLVAALPVAGLALGRVGLGRARLGQVVGALAIVLSVAALLATRSLGALAGLFVAVGWLVLRSRHLPKRLRWNRGVGLAVVALGGLALATAGPRLLDLTRGDDASAAARQLYARAALRGVAERPLVGWGPGASAWLFARHLASAEAADAEGSRHLPAEHIVADAHSLPLTLLYELGVGGCGLVALFLVAFLRCRPPVAAESPAAESPAGTTPADRALADTATAGLLGAATTATVSGLPLSVPGPWLVLAVVAGLRAAAWADDAEQGRDEQRRDEASDESTRWTPWALRGAAVLGVVLLVLGQVDRDLAQWRWQAQMRASTHDAEQGSEAARRRPGVRDPGFPAYGWSLALDAEPGRATFRRALDAARAADGLAPLWLSAGVLGLEARATSSENDRPWSAADEVAMMGAFDAACRLSPRGAMAPFHAAVASRGDDEATIAAAARALAAEPRLLAAMVWTARPALRAAAVGRLLDDERIDAVWRGAFADAWRAVRADELAEGSGDGARDAATPPAPVQLALWVDADASTSVSLHAFRRPPVARRLAVVDLEARSVAALERLEHPVPPLPSIAGEAEHAASRALFRGGCGTAK